MSISKLGFFCSFSKLLIVAFVEPISLPSCSIVSPLEPLNSFNLSAKVGKKKKNIKSPLDKSILTEYNIGIQTEYITGKEITMNQLKQIRLDRRWTQQIVADKLGITKAAYSNIENGYRSPSLKVALQMQKLFGIQIERLLENENSNPTPTKV